MSTRFLHPTRVAAAALAAGLVGLLAGPASAAPAGPEDAAATEHSESVQLSWDGSGYAATTTENFLGTPVTVPGDHATRTLLVRNDGPTDGTLRATIIDVELLDPDAPDVQHHPAHVAPDVSGRYAGAGDQGSFYDDLRVGWGGGGASLTQLADNGQTEILTIPLAHGEQVPITLDYQLPVAATSGNRANVTERFASFNVLLELGGELPAEPVAPEPTEPAAPEPTENPPAAQPQPPAMPDTGADLRLPALIVAVLLALGGVLVFAARRREDVRPHH